MAKKEIKELIIKTKSSGYKEVITDLKSVQQAIAVSTVSVSGLAKELVTSSNISKETAKTYDSIAKSMSSVTKSASTLNKALNGNTAAANKGLTAYVDNLTIATLYMRDLADEAERAAKSVAKVSSTSTNSQLDSMANFIEQIYHELIELNETSKESIRTLDRLAEKVMDVETQTKKGRIATRQAGETYKEYTARLAAAGVGTDNLNNKTRRLSGTGSQAKRAFSDLVFGMNPLVRIYASVAVNVYALTEAFRILNEAANLVRLEEQTARFSASLSGINIKALTGQLVELSGYAISTADALRQTVRGVSYGFTITEMEKLTKGARGASIALGVDFADAMDRVFRGISKGEVEILDEIGVVTRLDTAYKKYAVTLGKSADALTDVERRTALSTEVMSQLEQRFGGVSVAASGMESLSVAVTNAKDSILKLTATSLDKYASELADLASGFGGLQSSAKKATESARIYNEAMKAGKYSQAAVALSEYNKYMRQSVLETTVGTEENKKYTKSLEATKTAVDITSKVLSGLLVYMTYYSATVAVSMIKSTVMVVAALVTYDYALIKVGVQKTLLAVKTGIVTAAMTAYSAVLATVTAVTKAYRFVMLSAALANAAFAAPLYIIIGIVLAVVAGIAGLVYGFKKLGDYLGGGVITSAISAIGDMLSWLGDKVSEFLSWIGMKAKEAGKSLATGIGKGLDSISEGVGLTGSLEKTFGVDSGAIAAITSEQVDEYMAGLKKSASTYGQSPLLPEFRLVDIGISREEAEQNLKYLGSMKGALETIGAEVGNQTKYETSFSKLAAAAKSLADVPVSLNLDPTNYALVKTKFDNLVADKTIPVDIKWDDGKGVAEFSRRVDEAAAALKDYDLNGAASLERFNAALDRTDPTAGLQSVRRELNQVNALLETQKGLGEKINANDIKILKDKKALLDINAGVLEKELRIQKATDSQEIALQAQIIAMQETVHLQSQIIALEINALENRIQMLKAEGTYTGELEKQLELLKQQKGVTERSEARKVQDTVLGSEISKQETRVSQAGSASTKVAEQEKLLALKGEMLARETDALEVIKQTLELDNLKAQLARDKEAAPATDIGASLSRISGLAGLTDMQSTFASSIGSMSSTYGDFLSSMESDSMNFASFLGGNIDALADMTGAALNIAQSVFSEMSASKVAAIDLEIEAEQRRDGKSAESLAKIKQLNAKKIKEETKAKKASVAMSTAMAIMQSFAEFGIWGAIPAAAMAAMGVIQMANIDKAANGQLAALNGGSGKDLSISAGNRDNSIDVSKAANAGELGYLQGQAGTGTANNFIPGRAGGNYARAGAAITVGESGPEVIVPKVPVSVQPAGSTVGANITFSPQFNLSSVDTAGMDELMYKYSRSLYNGLERELNANNLSLDSLRA